VALIKLGNRDKAREKLKQAIQLDPKYARPYVNLARMDATDNNYAEAEELLKSAIDSEPDNAEALFLLSNAQLQNGRYDDAIASARKVHGTAHQGFEGAHVVCAMALAAENTQQRSGGRVPRVLEGGLGFKEGQVTAASDTSHCPSLQSRP
jgi:tetratricopeptide (TPR) repeat protein